MSKRRIFLNVMKKIECVTTYKMSLLVLFPVISPVFPPEAPKEAEVIIRLFFGQVHSVL